MQQQSLKLKILKWGVLVIAIGVILNYNAIASWIQEEMDNNMYLVERPVAVWHQTISQVKALAHTFLNPSGNRSAEAGNNDPNRWDRQGHKVTEREYQLNVEQEASKKPQDTGKDDAKDNGGSFVYNGATALADLHKDDAEAPQAQIAAVPHNASAAQDYNSEGMTDFYHRQASEGDAGAQYDLANMYYTGNGMEKNYNEAAGWYRKAADHGVVPAQVALGTMYSNGEGVDQDYNQAVKYWREAADHGNSDAELHLGNAYHEGKGVPKDDTEAVKWWGLAADRGNSAAQKLLKQYAPKTPQSP